MDFGTALEAAMTRVVPKARNVQFYDFGGKGTEAPRSGGALKSTRHIYLEATLQCFR